MTLINKVSMKRPHILVTNDDGVHSLGIRQLWNAVKKFADVTVVAPAAEQSAVSLSITIRHPLRINRVEWSHGDANVWSVSGTPSDCVKLALGVVMPTYPDLIVSGINHGNNAGRNVLYSGTIAAVIEGVLHNIPGIAFSIDDFFEPHFEPILDFIPRVIQYTLQHPLPSGTFLNVNFPSKQAGHVKGVRFTKQGKSFLVENPEQRSHPAEGHSYYWLGSKMAHFEEEEDSDVMWLQKGYAAAVPIHIGELTDRAHVQNQKQIFEKFITNVV